SQRKRHGERRPAPFGARDRDGSPVEPYQLVDERQPDAGAFVGASFRVFDAMEPLEHVGQLGFGDTDAGVRDAQYGEVGLTLDRDPDLALERELERVGEKIEDDLLPHVAIDEHLFRKLLTIDVQPKPGFLYGRSEYARELSRERRQVRRFIRGIDAA